MRVSYYLVAPLGITTVALTWWLGVRGKDFITPPTFALQAKQELAQNSEKNAEDETSRNAAIVVKPLKNYPDDPPLTTEEQPPEEEYIETGDLINVPAIDAYSELANKGATYLIRLATILESQAQHERALLAWERVLDSTQPSDEQRSSAEKALQRLKPQLPAWIVDPEARTSIIINAGCDTQTAKILAPLFTEIAKQLSDDTSGLIQFQTNITPNPSNIAIAKPIALWFSYEKSQNPKSKTITTPPASQDPTSLRFQLESAIYKLLREEMSSENGQIPPPKFDSNVKDVSPFFKWSITRRQWANFAERISQAL